ncbi:hypothetical protein ACU686_16910 [Yinghuangia aomiensis]
MKGVSAEPLAEQPCGADMLYFAGNDRYAQGNSAARCRSGRSTTQGETLVSVFGALYGFDESTVYLSPRPSTTRRRWRFAAGIVHRTGGTVVMMERFDAERALAAIEEHRVTHSQRVPTMFVRALKLPAEVRERVRPVVAEGGDPRGRAVSGRGEARR